jgi:hypothetical protein
MLSLDKDKILAYMIKYGAHIPEMRGCFGQVFTKRDWPLAVWTQRAKSSVVTGWRKGWE